LGSRLLAAELVVPLLLVQAVPLQAVQAVQVGQIVLSVQAAQLEQVVPVGQSSALVV